MKPNNKRAASSLLLTISAFLLSAQLASAILVQPNNYMLDEMLAADSANLSPFYSDQSGASEAAADKDIVSIIGDRLARLRWARMLEGQAEADQQHLSQEMAELMASQQGEQGAKEQQQQDGGSLVADMLLNVAQAAASAAGADAEAPSQPADSQPAQMTPRGSVMELDTTNGQSGAASSASQPSKADLKTSGHWFNPKEAIPVLKISSMATPSKYKKVYFRSEKKLVDGAFHSIPSNEQPEKKSFIKSAFNSPVQRRSSRGTSSSVAPPSVLQDGVIDFLKKFRDVYIQTRPVSTASGSSASSFGSSMLSAAASSPLAAVLSPSGARPSLASALSAATSMLGGAAQAASGSSAPASSSSSSSGSAAAAAAASSVANAVGSAVAGATGSTGAGSAASGPIRSPLSAQSYVSFWSKTFPTWVRKMLKQLRRRSLHNSSKRQQQHHHSHHHHHSASSAIGQAAQAAASSAVQSVVDSAASASSSAASSSSH